MKKNNSLKIMIGIFAIFIIVSLGYWYEDSKKPGEYDNFAKCLNENGAKFYGAFWCPHCQAQKALFGKSKDLLPYVECSLADGKGQTQICIDQNITSYPTWKITKGTSTEILTGEQTLETLSSKTNCPLN